MLSSRSPASSRPACLWELVQPGVGLGPRVTEGEAVEAKTGWSEGSLGVGRSHAPQPSLPRRVALKLQAPGPAQGELQWDHTKCPQIPTCYPRTGFWGVSQRAKETWHICLMGR